MAAHYDSIQSVFSELIRQYSNPSNKNEKGQNLIFKDYTWNMSDLESLTKNGFNINSTDNFGKTPIFYCKDTIQFRLLILFGANINHVDNEGKNLLFYVNEPENVELMLKLDINKNLTDIKNHCFLSHELFHTIPDVFSSQLKSTEKTNIEIFQVFTNTHNCLKLLNEKEIKFFLSKKVHINFDPLSNPVPFQKTLGLLKEIEASPDTKFTFYSDENKICNLYTLHQLEKKISKS
ncbi:hypothetical protein LZ359_13190 [Enterobacter hormaechei]|uniref:hypothetical protein n=2 Tax=Enterobacteriaceae TaxID=543 RepID=UPI001F43445A|nr:hypothetical protein [Enterobacter hormaechei]MCF1187583.1 hypothetical protein [Enterobacter hormaechei]